MLRSSAVVVIVIPWYLLSLLLVSVYKAWLAAQPLPMLQVSLSLLLLRLQSLSPLLLLLPPVLLPLLVHIIILIVAKFKACSFLRRPSLWYSALSSPC